MIRPIHHPVLRALGALLPGLLLLVQLADGSGVHRCPAHDGIGAPAMAMSQHAAMHHHGDPSGDHQHTGPCSCLGACHGASFALAAAEGTPWKAIHPRRTAPVIASAGDARVSRPHLRPFSIGPPRLVPSKFS